MNHVIIVISLLLAQQLNAEPITFNSGVEQNMLIELYTSEGCSSCPPADAFLSQFKDSDELWSTYIPVAFHVDYWDYLGWKDVFASPEYSQRQRQHKSQGNISSVYTPGFVIDGEEWAGFFKPWRSLPEVSGSPGVLKTSIDDQKVKLEFPHATNKLTYNLAVVGVGLKTAVKSGENAGDDLPHDFVVLDHQTSEGTKSAEFELPRISKHQPEQFAVVAWVSEAGSLKPIQATGGMVENTLFNSNKK